jgi:hypothetical protein
MDDFCGETSSTVLVCDDDDVRRETVESLPKGCG